MRHEIGDAGGLPLTIKAAGNNIDGFSAFVMEYCEDQCLVKHVIKEGFTSINAAYQEALKYKAEHPNFPWKEEE